MSWLLKLLGLAWRSELDEANRHVSLMFTNAIQEREAMGAEVLRLKNEIGVLQSRNAELHDHCVSLRDEIADLELEDGDNDEDDYDDDFDDDDDDWDDEDDYEDEDDDE